jgi:acyl carrier protein
MERGEALTLITDAVLELPWVIANPPSEPIGEATRLFDTVENGGLGIDSLDVIDAVMQIEAKLGVELDVDVSEIVDGTVGELATILCRLVPDGTATRR